MLAEAKKAPAFATLKLNDAVLSMAERGGLNGADRRDERLFDDEMLDMHEMIDGNYTPSSAADRGDIRRRSVLPGAENANEVMPHVEKKALPTVFGSVRASRAAGRAAPQPRQCARARAPCNLTRAASLPTVARAQAMEAGQ